MMAIAIKLLSFLLELRLVPIAKIFSCLSDHAVTSYTTCGCATCDTQQSPERATAGQLNYTKRPPLFNLVPRPLPHVQERESLGVRLKPLLLLWIGVQLGFTWLQLV